MLGPAENRRPNVCGLADRIEVRYMFAMISAPTRTSGGATDLPSPRPRASTQRHRYMLSAAMAGRLLRQTRTADPARRLPVGDVQRRVGEHPRPFHVKVMNFARFVPSPVLSLSKGREIPCPSVRSALSLETLCFGVHFVHFAAPKHLPGVQFVHFACAETLSRRPLCPLRSRPWPLQASTLSTLRRPCRGRGHERRDGLLASLNFLNLLHFRPPFIGRSAELCETGQVVLYSGQSSAPQRAPPPH